MTLHLDRRAADLAERVANYPGDHLLSADELAAWLAVSVSTIKTWRRLRVGPNPIRVGVRKIRYRKSAVVAWLEERARAGAAS